MAAAAAVGGRAAQAGGGGSGMPGKPAPPPRTHSPPMVIHPQTHTPNPPTWNHSLSVGVCVAASTSTKPSPPKRTPLAPKLLSRVGRADRRGWRESQGEGQTLCQCSWLAATRPVWNRELRNRRRSHAAASAAAQPCAIVRQAPACCLLAEPHPAPSLPHNFCPSTCPPHL